jgi:hypothetical protein
VWECAIRGITPPFPLSHSYLSNILIHTPRLLHLQARASLFAVAADTYRSQYVAPSS